MLKVLVFNNAIPSRESAGISWTQRRALCPTATTLLSEEDRGIIDHDVFVISSQSLSSGGNINEEDRKRIRKDVKAMLAERVAAGGCLVCFLDSAVIGWLPLGGGNASLQTRSFAGTYVRTHGRFEMEALALAIDEEPDFGIELFEAGVPYWDGIAYAKDGAVVAAIYKPGHGMVFLLPPMVKTREKVIHLLLDKIIPKKLPDLGRSHRDTRNDEPPPEWVGRVEVPGADTLKQGAAKVRGEIQALSASLEAKENELAERLLYRDLLWTSGYSLENLIRASLTLLDIDAQPQSPVDLVCDLGDGRKLYIEVEGSEGPTTLKKGQQLLSYIADAPDPASVLGAIISNPYRKSPPDQRPPTGSQAGLFVTHLEALAAKQGWPLITTAKLFEWVCRHLDGDAEAGRDARRALAIS